MPKKKPAAGSGKNDATASDAAKHSPRDGLRETIESVVIAFILAFLFRTFEAEAFVIPTGSMATTLMGRHKELVCSNCRFPYQASASDEEPRDHAPDEINGWQREQPTVPVHVVAAICPQCRYEMHFGQGGREEDEPHVSYNGDRILVAKFPYDIGDPQRWDVAVFKFPGRAKDNYIKRVVGVPDETLVVYRGDVLTAHGDEARGRVADELFGEAAHSDRRHSSDAVLAMWRDGAVELQRKPPAKARAMLQLVHDNNYLAPAPMPPRWAPVAANSLAATASAWETLDDGRTFSHTAKGEKQGGEQQSAAKQDAADQDAAIQDAWIGYQHRVPLPRDWLNLKKNRDRAKPIDIPPSLINDFYAYNSNSTDSGPERNANDRLGSNWVGDLSVACQANIRAPRGELLLALVEGGCQFECRIDVVSGMARLSISDAPELEREIATPVRGAGDYHLQFANIDDELLLWVDGKLVEFDGKFGPLANHVPTREDLTPARLGSRGADVRFYDLKLLRDVYYTSTSVDNSAPDHPSPEFFRDPSQWGRLESTFVLSYELEPDQYFMLGDNSPRSADGRSWQGKDLEYNREYYVRRDLFIGKAVFIYWPHAWRVWPSLWLPFYPNVKRMEFVR